MTLRLASVPAGWRAFCADPERLDARLREALDAGAPILLTSRFSTPTGENARTSAINSLYEAARVLARQTGIDVSEALPSRAELDVRLQSAPAIRSKRLHKGQDILHRFVTMDLRPNAPVIILVATGSGRLAAEGFIQPFTQRAAQLVWETEAAVLGTKRWDRTTRNDDLVGPLFVAMDEHATWICTDKLFREMNDETRLLLMVESYAARANTGGEDHAKRLGQADRTGRRMIDGQVAYHLPSAPAPGLGVATMKRRPGLDTEKVAYLDMPGCRPDPARVAQGLSEVRAADGEVVDQVANVRFFLAHYGDPSWMDNDRLFKELARRKFSTVHVRGLYGAEAHATSSRGHTAWQSIVDNLDMYETGVLRREPGGAVATVEIAGVMPPDGPWATPDDFARIRSWMAKGKERAGKAVHLSLAGLRATYDGVGCRSRSVAFPSTTHADRPCLAFRRVADDGNELAVPASVLLPYDAFAESIADAIVAAGTRALAPLLDAVTADDAAAAGGPAARAAELEARVEALERSRDGLLAQLGETHADGTPVLRGKFLDAAQRRFEAIVDDELPALEEQRQQLAADLQAAAKRPDDAAVDPALLPRLLASLRDPFDRSYARLWRRIITQLEFTTGPSRHPGKTSRLLTWRGVIRLDAGERGTVAVPFGGSYDYRRRRSGEPGRSGRYVERQLQYLEQMLAGTPYPDIDLPGRHVNRPRVAKLLEVDPGHPIFSVMDPTIVATATAMLRAAAGDEDVAVPQGDERFLDAVRRVHVSDRSARAWKCSIPKLVIAFYELAAHNGTVPVQDVVDHCETTPGTVHTTFSTLRKSDPNWSSRRKKGYVLAPCERCGSHDRRPAQIGEISGLLCGGCRHDEAGVHWDVSAYARYAFGGGAG